MRRFFIWLIFIAAVLIAAWYFVPSAHYAIQGVLQNFSPKAGVSPRSVASSTEDAIQKALDQAGRAAAEKSQQAKQGILQAVSDAAQNALQSAKDKIAESLGISPAAPAGQAAPNPAPSAAPDLSVCAAFRKGDSVDYAIQNPFSPPEDFKFSVNWGDGKTTNGSASAADGGADASHVYGQIGTYIDAFTLSGATQTISIQRKVCIE